MAYSSVRVQFEIGHEASVRTKKTPEGFTHDWEVFVRGADNTDIQYFVEKVVFHLHETFPKPRRVIKEPPYIVKESGYAGFVLPIDVYLKNKEEPKKISFQYDLTLQSSGPPISRVLREPRLFQNPSEDFRRKLIRGGGVGVDTPSEVHTEDSKLGSIMPQNKLKPAESPMKKHKPELPLNDSFAELFGIPIRRVPEQKKLPEIKKLSEEKKKPIKPYEKETVKEKEKYSEKERKDRDKSKEKTKRPSSLPPPPPPLSAPTPPPQIIKSKDEHKKHEEKEKKKEDYKRKEEKEKKEKAKEPEKLQEHRKEKKDDYAKKLNSKPPDLKPNYDKPNNEVADKEKERLEKEKHKHRHKKKEKEKNRDKEKYRKEKDKDPREFEKDKISKKRHEDGREKEEKKRKSRSLSPVQIKKGPLNALLDELGSSDSASPLSDEESIPPVKPLPKPVKVVREIKLQPLTNVTKPKSTNSVELERPKLIEDSVKVKKEKSKKKQEDKRKEELRERSPSSEREEEEEKERKEEKLEKERLEEEKLRSKDKENRKRKREKSEEKHVKPKKEASSQSEEVPEEIRKSDKFTKEYVAQLKDLQHRIMTLEDNAELQKVVKVIAETGQYEITKKTFDFDLCALDIETVKRLQEFFAPT